jgi:hypothetical protein
MECLSRLQGINDPLEATKMTSVLELLRDKGEAAITNGMGVFPFILAKLGEFFKSNASMKLVNVSAKGSS